ncbi:MAG: amidohydrolase family protein [Gammaproteobacteria bacterium]|nr:amidohydrolase family protein [Gammaproteobacteria bacterium]
MKQIKFTNIYLLLYMLMFVYPVVSQTTHGDPDMIVFNAKIITMDDPAFSSDPGTITHAMAIKGDKIQGLGSNEVIQNLAGPETKMVNLNGRTVMPSFILTHEHPTDWAWTEPSSLNHVFPEGNDDIVVRFLEGTADEQIASWEVVLEEAVNIARPGQWIFLSSDFGGNFEHMPKLFTDFFRHVSLQRINELAPDNPVRVKNGFIRGLVNERGVEEISRIFPDEYTGGGSGDRGPEGQMSASGRMLEPDIMLHGKTDKNADLLKAQMELWTAHGITTFGSAPYTLNNLRALSELDQQGEMPARFAWSYSGPNEEFQTIRLMSALVGNGSDYLWNIGSQGQRVGGTCTTLAASERVKRTESCVFDPGQPGRRVLEDIVRTGGRVAAMHTGGDKDIDNLMDVIEEQSAAAGLSLDEIRSRRHAFDHASGAPRPDQIPRIKRLGMMISMINTVLWENRTGYDVAYRVRNYGEEYAHYAVPRNSVTQAGIMNTQEIDRALPHFIFYNLWVGMTRYNYGCDRTFAEEEGTDLITQLKALTTWGAHYVLREDRLGSLEPGKIADFVVLDRDILTIPEDDIPNIKVLMTVLGGKTVHLLPNLANEIDMPLVGPVIWPTKPLENRYVFRGPPKSCPPFQNM